MASYVSLDDLNTYSGQTVDPTLGQLLLDVTTSAIDSAVNRSFQLIRTTEMHYGQGNNTLMLRNYPVQQVNHVHVIMPGALQFDIPISQLLVQPEIGKVVNYTPLMFQMYGYTAVFPDSIPIQVDYSYGPNKVVYGDTGKPDAAYQVYSFTNGQWFTAAQVNVYKNGILLDPSAYTVSAANGQVTLKTAGVSADTVTADYWCYAVPDDIRLACLMLAVKQLNLPKTKRLMYASEGDSDYKVTYGLADALAAMDTQVNHLLASYKRKGVW